MTFIPIGQNKLLGDPKLDHKPEICNGCPARSEPGPVWSSCDSTNPRLIIVGEAPGGNEIIEGKGFVGQSGKLLWTMLSRAGIRREECYVANAAKCVTKNEGAFSYCAQHFLRGEIQSLPGDIPVLALGNEAKRVLQPELNQYGIVAARGSRSGRILCALHPAFIRRSIRFAAQEEDKQDLTPTLIHDAYACLHHPSPKEIRYVEGLPPNIHQEFRSCDLETQGFDSEHGNITDIGWGVAPGIAYREHYTENHRSAYELLLNSPTVFHNMLFDVPWLRRKGYTVPEPHCSMLAAHLLTPDLPLGLEFQNSLYVHYHPWKRTNKTDHDKYHATDLDTTYQVWERQRVELDRKGLWSNYINEVRPVTLKCIDMKLKGIRCDQERMMKFNYGFQMRVEQIDESLGKVAPGVDFNSPKQVGVYLYDVLKLPEQVHKKSGARTTDADALDELASIADHPVLKLLRTRRAYEKMRTTYTQYVLDSDGYYHHDISFTAATGRARGFLLTMQKGPMRSIFIPDHEGWEFLYADWSQVELWISAVCSRDRNMLATLEGASFHAQTAARFFGGEPSKKHPKYNESKFITHGANFGRGEISIARDHELDLGLVRNFLKFLSTEFPQWYAWRAEQYRQAYNDGYITNEFGFTRHFWSGNIKGMAYSFKPQSIPAHMMKRTILSLWDELPQPARIVLPVHDALLICYPKSMREEVTKVVKEHMEQPWAELGGWRAKCEIGYGDNWQEAS